MLHLTQGERQKLRAIMRSVDTMKVKLEFPNPKVFLDLLDDAEQLETENAILLKAVQDAQAELAILKGENLL